MKNFFLVEIKNFIHKQKYFKIIEISTNEDWEIYLKEVNSSYVTSINNYYLSFKLFKFKKFIIKDKSRNIGIFQICFVGIGKFIFIRLNLGPCFFPNVSNIIKKEAINYVINGLYPNKVKFFLISPNLRFDEENIIFNHKNHILIYSGAGWNSIKINLKQNLKMLKIKLKNNLRRDIVKKNICKKYIIKNINTSEEFSIFIKNYNAQKKIKKFKGVSEKILKDLFLSKKLIVLNAYIKKDIISSICVALHGNTATYLVGLNLNKFESANDLLLWKIIIFLKRNNFYKFDLGGIDFVNNRNVSIFKSNFGGEKYQLVGSKFLIK